MTVTIKERLSAFRTSRNKWRLLWLIPITAAVILVIWLAQPEAEPVRTLAEPLLEDKVTFDLEVNQTYSAEDGVVVIQPSSREQEKAESSSFVTDPAQIWEDSSPLSTDSYTLPEEVTAADGSIGMLTIPSLNLSAPVYEAEEGEELESMTRGIAHFAVTSAWEGNIGLCSHNEAPAGAVAYFRDIHLLEQGDVITYTTSLGERQYRVNEVREIAEDDWSPLSPNQEGENKIVLITCITGKPDKRLMVQASEQ